MSFAAILFCCSGGYNFFPWRQELEAVAETHAKASFLQFQKGRSALFRYCLSPVLSFTAMLLCCSGRYKFFPSSSRNGAFRIFPVLFGTRFVLHCHAALLFGRVRLSPMATRVRSSSRNSCESFFSTVQKKDVRHLFGVVLHPFCIRFVLHCHSVLLFGRVSYGTAPLVRHPLCVSLTCCFAVRES